VTPPVWLVKSHIEAGTLELFEDQRGLRMRASLDMRDPDVRSIVPKMQRGDLDKMSFAFIPTRQKWKDVDGKDLPRRTIEEAELYDVSIVTTPAYSGTEIGLRSLEQFRNSQSWLFKRSTSALKCAALT
jgi:HK97 family phage prohead protease